MGMRFPLGAGINGLAAQGGEPIWTFDYLADPRIPHEPDDDAVARRLGCAAWPPRRCAPRAARSSARSPSRPRTAHLRGGRPRPAPGPRRPGRHRAHQLESPGPADASRRSATASSSRTPPTSCGRSVADARHHVPLPRRRAPDRLPARRAHRQALRRRSSMSRRARSPRSTGRRRCASRLRRCAAGSTSSIATARRSRPSSSPSRRSTRTARSPAPTDRSATCANATGSSASCAPPRTATGPWPRRRRTSSSPPTPKGATRSSPTGRRRSSAGIARPRSVAIQRVRRAGVRGRCCGQLSGGPRRPDGGPFEPHGLPRRLRPAGPARHQCRRQGRGRPARRHQRRGPRRLRAGAPRARAQALRGALPLPGPELAGRRVLHRRRRPLHVHLGRHRAADRLSRRGAHRQALRHDRRLGGAPGRGRPLGFARDRPGPGGPGGPDPARSRRSTDAGRRARGRRHGRRQVRGDPGRRARRRATRSASSASCAARPGSWPPARSGRTWPASSTTRSRRRSSR